MHQVTDIHIFLVI